MNNFLSDIQSLLSYRVLKPALRLSDPMISEHLELLILRVLILQKKSASISAMFFHSAELQFWMVSDYVSEWSAITSFLVRVRLLNVAMCSWLASILGYKDSSLCCWLSFGRTIFLDGEETLGSIHNRFRLETISSNFPRISFSLPSIATELAV